MLRSMFSGVSGLRSHQTMMDVTGNNIANVNTTGYKSSRVVFADTLSQLNRAAGAPQNGNGGVNPSQVGLGVRVQGIQQNFQQGSAQSTGKATDLMLDGDGLFVVQNGNQVAYTRSGAFSLDSTGALTTPEGAYVQGWRADARGNIDVNAPTTQIIIPSDTVMPAQESNVATLKGNIDKTGKPVLNTDNTTFSGPEVSTSFELYDGQGNKTLVTARYKNVGVSDTAASAEAYQPTDDWRISFTWKDASGATVTSPTTATIKFGPDGKVVAGSPPPATFDFGGKQIDFNMSTVTGFTSINGASTLSSNADGAPIGSLTSFDFGADGIVTGTYSNGFKRPLAQVAVATFNNYGGMQKLGGSLLTTTPNSGAPNVGVPGIGGRGALLAGQVEMSNVDLSTEFTNLILAQRGFQANSRIISASDEILQDLVNLKR
ncbi:flagellar hook protein FlgE [Kineococcus sp. NUM-3379]